MAVGKAGYVSRGSIERFISKPSFRRRSPCSIISLRARWRVSRYRKTPDMKRKPR